MILSESYALLPEHMRDGMKRYVEDGMRPGDFLMAILENDFVHASARADDVNKHALHQYAVFLLHAPWRCWGSHEKVLAWIGHEGMRGLT